jgi:hypothetical protein
MNKNKCEGCPSYFFDGKSKAFFCNEKNIKCPGIVINSYTT